MIKKIEDKRLGVRNIKNKKHSFMESRLGIVFVYCCITTLIIAAFYPLIPKLLNYPPNNEEVSTVLGTSNLFQYIAIIAVSLIIGSTVLLKIFKKINSWFELEKNNPEDIEKLKRVRETCINMPYYIFLVQALSVFLLVVPIGVIVTALNRSSNIIVIKVGIMVLSIFSLAAVLSHIFSKRIFTRILLKTYYGADMEGIRIGLSKKIFIQVLPIIIVAMLFTSLIGYSQIIEEKGNLIYNFYKESLTRKFYNTDNTIDINNLFKEISEINLNNTREFYFVRKPNDEIVTSDGSELSEYFKYYIDNPYKGNRMYDLNAEHQGVIIKYTNKEGEWKLGIIFKINSNKSILYFLFGFIFLLFLNIFALYYFSRSLSGEISLIAKNLTEIAEGEDVDLDRKLAVISNDELGDLVVAFNKIQEREKQHIERMQETQAILIEQERLASLGQLIGGIAHNLKTPIMSIAGGIEALNGLITEYEESIYDDNVTKEDHEEIAKEMLLWTSRMKPYCSYMSDIISTVRDQTAISTSTKGRCFTLNELTRRLEMLVNHELISHNCRLNIDCSIDLETQINGEISNLLQILSNIIINATHAYDKSGGVIDFKVEDKRERILFSIRDYGRGIDEDIKNKLFKEMVTSKGKNGTGLGLFISYSNVKVRFKGEMWFESQKDKGTTFYISVPKKYG